MKRKWLYKKDVEPTIFKGDAIQEALDNGWQPRPVSNEPEDAMEAVVVEKQKVIKPTIKKPSKIETKGNVNTSKNEELDKRDSKDKG